MGREELTATPGHGAGRDHRQLVQAAALLSLCLFSGWERCCCCWRAEPGPGGSPGWIGELMDTHVHIPWLQREPLQPEAQEQP